MFAFISGDFALFHVGHTIMATVPEGQAPILVVARDKIELPTRRFSELLSDSKLIPPGRTQMTAYPW